MAPPPVSIYVTSLTSQPKVRQHIDLLRRSLRGLEIPFEEHDLVIDEDAKKRWQRSKPPGVVVGLPGYLVGGEWVGTMDDFEDAVETQRLHEFLKQDLDLSSDPAPPSAHDRQTSASSAPTATTTTAASGTGSGPTAGGAAASGAGGSTKTVQEVELEKLMREMTDSDLDKLMSELGVEESSVNNKIGLLDSSNNTQDDGAISDVKETKKELIAELKEEARLDDVEEDIVLRNASPQPGAGAANPGGESSRVDPSAEADNKKKTSNAILGEEGLGVGEGAQSLLKSMNGDEGDLLSELKDELRADKNEEKEIGEAVAKEKVD
ncbi:hypothetical protein I317_01971 [Kwoniella heveanensis CBS 569]|uniref:Uncharacterized protein n=1 Tax=Kwoniella heveanensis BCC8398 TaxID=1296120 RepID=A0A1B9GZG2_9TREE|nr:hypothetical protein I316_01667 [Kwoniella heveanensis BCC8398]OCF44179.1 hypothetical protein I317_01971 [Kwoniella heveanensis CBS 569]